MKNHAPGSIHVPCVMDAGIIMRLCSNAENVLKTIEAMYAIPKSIHLKSFPPLCSITQSVSIERMKSHCRLMI